MYHMGTASGRNGFPNWRHRTFLSATLRLKRAALRSTHQRTHAELAECGIEPFGRDQVAVRRSGLPHIVAGRYWLIREKRNWSIAKIIEKASDLFFDGRLEPVVSATIAIAVNEISAHLVFIAGNRQPSHGVWSRTIAASSAWRTCEISPLRPRCEQLALNSTQSHDRLPEGKG